MRDWICSATLLGIFVGMSGAQAGSCTTTTLAVTHGSSGSNVYGSGSGCILKPIVQVWAALKTEQTMSFDGSTLVSSNLRSDSPAGVLYSYENNYTAGGIFSVSWTMQWNHMLKSGSVTQPSEIEVRYSKVDGTSFISFWQGIITLEQSGAGATAVTLRNEINASQTDENDAAATVQQIFDKLK